MSYKDWDEGEPSSNGQCGYMRPEKSYTWDDCQCDLKQAFLCKIMKRMIFKERQFEAKVQVATQVNGRSIK